MSGVPLPRNWGGVPRISAVIAGIAAARQSDIWLCRFLSDAARLVGLNRSIVGEALTLDELHTVASPYRVHCDPIS